jgi:surface protein
MFYECARFNQPLRFDTRRVSAMILMFYGCVSLNQPLLNWRTRAVDSMLGMFVGCSAFNQPLGYWDTSSVTCMYVMFAGCSAFNQPLGNWDTTSVVNMHGMFRECENFNQPLEDWDTSAVEMMSGMFRGCTHFNQPLDDWDTSVVDNMSEMFHGCTRFNQSLVSWDMRMVDNATDMFLEAPSMLEINKPAGITGMGGVIDNHVPHDAGGNAGVGGIAFRVHTFFDHFNISQLMLLLQSDPDDDVSIDMIDREREGREEERREERREEKAAEDDEERREEKAAEDDEEEDIYAYAVVNEYVVDSFEPHQMLSAYTYDADNDIAFMPHDIIVNLFTFIQDIVDEDAQHLAMQRLFALESRIMTLSLTSVIQENPEIVCADVIRLALAFVRRQPAAFRANYAETFTHDCATAYDSGVGIHGNLSCSQGVWERLVTSIANGGVGTDVPLYQEIASTMQNSVTPEIIQTFTAQCVNAGAVGLLQMPDIEQRAAWVKTAVMHKLVSAGRTSQIHPVLPAVDEFVEAARSMLEDDLLEK